MSGRAPIPYVTTRYMCGAPTCSRSFGKKASAEGHMSTCWRNPTNRACHSCAHFTIRSCCSTASDMCGCLGERDWVCSVDVELRPGEPITNCDQWEEAPRG